MEHTIQKSAWCWFKTMNLKLNKLRAIHHASCEAEALPLKYMHQKWNVEIQTTLLFQSLGSVIFLLK